MAGSNPSVNAGVHANVGMDFQKHCAIYLFLERYETIKNERYFIIIEHHDDIVFGFLDQNNALKKVETYQAKKSSKAWTITTLIEIIHKIVQSSKDVVNDSHPKTNPFEQINGFITNHTIKLRAGKKPNIASRLVNETDDLVTFKSLDREIRKEILKGNAAHKFTKNDLDYFDNIIFSYVDLGKKSSSQLELLQGKFNTVFGEDIADSKAALDTFLKYLHEIESRFNQGNAATLQTSNKRLESPEINDLLNILTKKKMAFKVWRNQADVLSNTLQIPVSQRTVFELHLQNSFDKLKDLTEAEHHKVFNFVEEHQEWLDEHFTDGECIERFYSEFTTAKSTTLSDIQLKAVITASYIEIKP